MAKKQAETNTEERSEIQVSQIKSQALAVPGASQELMQRIEEVRDNLDSMEDFKLPRVKMTADGAELIEGEEPLEKIQGVIVHAKKTNVFYAKPYNPNDVGPPDCFSLDGETPDASVEAPQNPTCRGCPKAEFGTNAMGSGKACRNLKPIFLLLGDEAVLPRQLSVTPTSLKAANQYLMNLTERGLSYRKVVTEIEFYKENSKDTYRKLRFKLVGKLDAQKAADVEALRKFWLPAMNNQIIEQAEFETTDAPISESTKTKTNLDDVGF